jgi:tetratricopeptide (TPR) repeat protein
MRFNRAMVVFALAGVACHAQIPVAPQNTPVPTQPSTTSHAPLPPSPPDAPVLDQGAIPVPDNSDSTLKRALHRFEPNCLDATFHLCWSSPPANEPVYSSYEKRRVAEDLEVGSSYLKEKNYRGAKLRFEDALTYESDNPEATFKLAESLAELGNKAEARERYQDYLKIEPDGVFADRAKRALQKLQS